MKVFVLFFLFIVIVNENCDKINKELKEKEKEFGDKRFFC